MTRIHVLIHFFDTVHVVLPLVYTVDVLPQPDMLLIGLSSVALRHRLAVMKHSRVTPVTLVLDTFKQHNLVSQQENIASMQVACCQIWTFSRQETLIFGSSSRQCHLLSWLAAAIEKCLVVVRSFLIVSLRRMSANHCCELVMVSFPAKCCRLFAPAPVSSSWMESLIHDRQFDHCSCPPDPES